jgi:Fe-S cluster assembly protein SufB
MSTEVISQIDVDRTRGDFHYPEQHTFDAGVGLSHATIDYIVDVKGEPDWIREFVFLGINLGVRIEFD